jgi:dethiobiotin synthase
MSLIVTGTDTGVGKTVVSALLLLRYAGRQPRYWKPVATGAASRDSSSIDRWTEAPVIAERYLYHPPVSPHLAARRARRPIDPAGIVHACRMLEGWPLVIEGIGGALVPLTDRGFLFADLCRALRLPCLVVARSTLGTINHTLLTLEALRTRRVSVAGVVFNGPPDRENRRAVERFGRTRVLAQVPPLGRLSAAALRRAARRFDPRGALERHLA